MKIIQKKTDLEKVDYSITIGNFDGVHLGHRELLSLLDVKNKTIVYTFNSHPNGNHQKKKFKLLTTPLEKEFLLKKLNIEYLFLLELSNDLLQLSPIEFLRKYLPEKKFVKQIVVGADFAFGKNRTGTVETLRQYFESALIKVCDFKKNENKKISSSSLRNNIINGDLKKFELLTSSKYFFINKIEKGNQLGRTIGFPTINLRVSDIKLLPPYGVYLSTITHNNNIYFSITNIGKNPTIDDKNNPKVESYIINYHSDFDFDKCIIKLEIIKFIRFEMKFNSLEKLKDQIALDLKVGRKCYI